MGHLLNVFFKAKITIIKKGNVCNMNPNFRVLYAVIKQVSRCVAPVLRKVQLLLKFFIVGSVLTFL